MLNSKVYVVTSIDLVNAVNRNSKALALNPFIAIIGKRITGHDEATSQIVQHNLKGENGPGYVTDVHDATISSLAPGKALEDMTKAMLLEASVYLCRLKHNDVVELFAWTKHMVTMCSTRAIYGPNNPFNKSEGRLVEAFWDFDRNLNTLLINLAPSLFAPRGEHARSVLGHAFQEYFEQYKPEEAGSAKLTEARQSTNTKYGLTFWNQARLEVGVLLGILANTIPAVFYTLIHVFSDPILLHDIREEIETTSLQDTAGEPVRYLKVLTMRENCGLLLSTFQEMLRVHALGSSSRYVREDVLLQDQYLLKKGMVVQMPISKTNAAAYRPFGGGASLCPGRHFVTLETMALTASLVLRFDMAPVEGDWRIPTQKQESMATNVFPPEEDIRVKIRERQGYQGVNWGFVMT
ncbi:MAG: hypothetical protein M1835_007131 [Candelina submexicana]|nr:MAG: hypothetical protein M1835_007131 [Candelina submexicana]